MDDTVLGLTPERRLVVADLLDAVAGLVNLRVGEIAFRTAVEVVAAMVRYDTSNAARSAATRRKLHAAGVRLTTLIRCRWPDDRAL